MEMDILGKNIRHRKVHPQNISSYQNCGRKIIIYPLVVKMTLGLFDFFKSFYLYDFEVAFRRFGIRLLGNLLQLRFSFSPKEKKCVGRFLINSIFSGSGEGGGAINRDYFGVFAALTFIPHKKRRKKHAKFG